MQAVPESKHPLVTRQMPQDIVAEANHRIANSLTLLVSVVRMQAAAAARLTQPPTKDDLRQALEAIAARISTVGQLHRLLSHVPGDGCTSVQPHLREVSTALVAALSSPGQAVKVTHGGGDCLVLTRQVQPIILILCEIFINAMKYAHPSGVEVHMTVDCHPGPDGRLVIAIADDGVGLPEGTDPLRSAGLGFRVIRSLAAEIGASLNIHSDALGLCFRLSLPASALPSGQLA